MRKQLIVALFAISGLVGSAAIAGAADDTWNIDPAHSAVNFTIKHLMVSNVTGSFHDVSGTVLYDGSDLSRASVKASITARSIDTSIAQRDQHLRSKDILDAIDFPIINFQSITVSPASKGRFKIAGTLTMHGVTHDVVLDAAPLSPIVRDSDNKLHTSTTASAELNRKDFGVFVDKPIDRGGTLVGENVKVNLQIALVKPAP
jgi:polyisoprenoid-binding protein YceI